MGSKTAESFSRGCTEIRAALAAFDPAKADTPYRPQGWTRKQILGHLLDSAANNHQRFVRATLQGHYTGPGYDQQGWVILHAYAEMPWETLLQRWDTAHQTLEQVVALIPEERVQSTCFIGDDAPVTLQFLIEDYIAHQRHHLAQILS